MGFFTGKPARPSKSVWADFDGPIKLPVRLQLLEVFEKELAGCHNRMFLQEIHPGIGKRCMIFRG
jgi:hypothetical protein